jgi:hypothetical protein
VIIIYVVKFTPSIILLCPSLFRIVSAGLIFPFHTWVHNISTLFTLLHPFLISLPLTPVTTPRQDLFYLPSLHFWKKMFFA